MNRHLRSLGSLELILSADRRKASRILSNLDTSQIIISDVMSSLVMQSFLSLCQSQDQIIMEGWKDGFLLPRTGITVIKVD